jgi:hypothetical protein
MMLLVVVGFAGVVLLRCCEDRNGRCVSSSRTDEGQTEPRARISKMRGDKWLSHQRSQGEYAVCFPERMARLKPYSEL